MADLSHINAQGDAHMVDVSGKSETTRIARAQARVTARADTIAMVQNGTATKGDVLATARIAAIMAAKKTSDLIPLCHPLPIKKVTVEFVVGETDITIETQVKTQGQTGVEMEALTAASIAALTLYDMLKAVEKGITISYICLLEKQGGKSGHWVKGHQ